MPDVIQESHALEFLQVLPHVVDEETRRAGAEFLSRYERQQQELGLPLYPELERQAEQKKKRLREVFTDLTAVDRLAPAGAENLRNSQNPDDDRRYTANLAFLQQRAGADSQSYLLARDQYAAQAWGEPQVDDAKFYSLAAKQLEQEAATEKAANEAFAAGMAAAFGDKSDSVAALSEFQKTPGILDLPATERRKVYAAFRKGHEHVWGTMSGWRVPVADLAKTLQKQMQGESVSSEKLKSYASMILDASPTERRTILTALMMGAKKLGKDSDKGFFASTGESFARTIEDMFLPSGGGMEHPRRLDEIQRTLELSHITEVPRIESEAEAREWLREQYIRRVAANPPPSGFADVPPLGLPRGEERKLSKDEISLVRGEIERSRTAANVARELRQIARSTDPLMEGYGGLIASTLGSSGALLAAAFVTRGASIPITAQGYANATYEDLKLKYPQMNSEDAEAISLISGPLLALGDQIGAKGLTAFPAAKALIQGGLTKAIAKRALGRTAIIGGVENLVELGQDVTPLALQELLGAFQQDMPGVDLAKEFPEGFWKSRADVAIGMFPLILLGVGGGAIKDGIDIRSIRFDSAKLDALGIQPEAATRILDLQQQGNHEAAASAYQEAWKNKRPMDLQKLQDLGAINDKEAAAIEQEMKEAGVTIRRESDAWVVRQNADGAEARFETADEAIEGFRSAVSQRNIEADENLMAAFEALAEKAKPGEEFSILDRTASLQDFWNEAKDRRDAAVDESGRQKAQSEMDAIWSRWQVERQRHEAAGLPELPMSKLRVLGQSVTEFREGVATYASRIFQGGGAIDAVEEKAENDVRRWVLEGRTDYTKLADAIRQLETVTGDKYLHGEGETAVVEAYSALARLYVTGTRKQQGGKLTGAARTGQAREIKAVRQRLRDSKFGGLPDKLRETYDFFKAALGQVARLARAKKEGKLGDIERFLAESAQLTEAQEHVRGVEAELVSIDPEYRPPTAEQEAAGMAFSLAPFGTLGEAEAHLRSISGRKLTTADGLEATVSNKTAGKMVSESAVRKSSSLGAHLWALANFESLFEAGRISETKPDRINDPNIKAIHRVLSGDGSRSVKFTVKELAPASQGSRIYSIESIETESAPERKRDDANTVSGSTSPPQSGAPGDSFTEGGGSQSFSLMPSRYLEAISERFARRAKEDPPKRREMLLKMQARLHAAMPELQAVIDQNRTVRSIEKESAMRQATAYEREYDAAMSSQPAWVMAALSSGAAKLEDHPLVFSVIHDHGGILSKTEAMRRGRDFRGEYDGAPWLPPKLWGGVPPDVLATRLHEEGMLSEPTPDALWNELQTVLASHAASRDDHAKAVQIEREARQKASAAARSEASAWRADAMKKAQGKAATKDRLLSYLRLLDALLSPLPAEVRAKVGGFVQLAELSTDEARAREIARRVEVIDRELERYLRKEIGAEIEALFDKARPKGDPGEQKRGKIGPEAHAAFSLAEEFSKLDEAGIEGRRKEIEHRISDPAASAKDLADASEADQILDLFGGLAEKTASQMHEAMEWLRETYDAGRSKWRAVIEARRAEDQANREAAVRDIGIEGIPAEQQKALEASTKAAAKSKGFIRSLMSLDQVLASALGRRSEIGRKIVRAMRMATNAKTDATLKKRAAFNAKMAEVFGTKSRVKWRRKLWEHSQLSSELAITVTKSEGGVVEVERIPAEVVRRWIEGTADPAAFKVDAAQAALLMESWADNEVLPPRLRKDNLELLRPKAGKLSQVKLSQFQAVHLTMMARQADYAEILAGHGWTEEVLAEIERQLTPEAAAIRNWLASEYAVGWKPLNEVFQRMHGVSLPQIANYSPGTFEARDESPNSIDPYGQGLLPEGGMRAGMLKTRRMHNAKPRLEDALSVYWGHIAATEHFKAFAEPVREAKAALAHADTRAALQAKDARLVESVNGWITALERNGLETRSQGSALDGLLRGVQSRQAYIALAYNLGTLMKQSTAAFGSLLNMSSFGDAARALGRLASGKLDLREMFNSDLIQRRMRLGYSPEVRQALAALMADKPSLGMGFVERGMDLIGFADAFFTTASAAMAYDFHFREAKAAGMSDAQAKAAAMQEAAETVARTAQPTENIDRSLFELGLSPMSRFGFMFMTEGRQKFALAAEAYMPSSGLTAKQRALRLLILHGLIPVMVQTITNAWRDARDDEDDEIFDEKNWRIGDYLRAMLLGPLTGVPWVGSALNAATARLFGQTYYNNDPALPFERAASSISDLMDITEEDGEAAVKDAKNILEAAALFFGGLMPPLVPAGVGMGAAADVFSVGDNLIED